MMTVWRVWDDLETVENRLMTVMIAMTVVGAVVLPWVCNA